MNTTVWRIVTLVLGLFFSTWAFAAQEKAAPAETRNTQDTLLDIQRELIALDQQFELIRQDLFFPKDKEVLFYLRNQTLDKFPFASIELTIDGKQIYQHAYTDAERVAFKFSNLQP